MKSGEIGGFERGGKEKPRTLIPVKTSWDRSCSAGVSPTPTHNLHASVIAKCVPFPAGWLTLVVTQPGGSHVWPPDPARCFLRHSPALQLARAGVSGVLWDQPRRGAAGVLAVLLCAERVPPCSTATAPIPVRSARSLLAVLSPRGPRRVSCPSGDAARGSNAPTALQGCLSHSSGQPREFRFPLSAGCQRVAWEKEAPELSGLLGRGCCQRLSLAVAHRFDTGGNAAKKHQREVAGAKLGGLEEPCKTEHCSGFQYRLPGQQPDQHVPRQRAPEAILGCRPARRFLLLH